MTRNIQFKASSILLVFCIAASLLSGGQGDKSKVQIHLPREITVEKYNVLLGDISVMFGDEELKDEAKKISLGKITKSGQGLVIDRKTILARLACNDVDVSKVKLTGAEKIIVSTGSSVLEDDKFVQAAKAFLGKQLLAGNVCHMEVVYSGGDQQIAGEVGELNFKCSRIAGTSRNFAKVKVQVFDGEKYLCERDINFRLKFKVKKMIAKEDIERGQVLTADKFSIQEHISDYPARYELGDPVGLVAKRKLVKGVEIRPVMLQSKNTSVVIKRNKNLIIRVEKYGFVLTLTAKALEDGTEGDLIRVRNIDSERIITVKINADGTASPVI